MDKTGKSMCNVTEQINNASNCHYWFMFRYRVVSVSHVPGVQCPDQWLHPG